MNCMSSKVERARAKLEAKRYKEEVKNRTPEEQAEIDKGAREGMQALASAMAITAITGNNSYVDMLLK